MAWQSAIGRGCVHESPLDVDLASTTRAHLRPSAAYADPSPASTVGKRRKAAVRRYGSSQRGSVTPPTGGWAGAPIQMASLLRHGRRRAPWRGVILTASGGG